MAKCSTNGVELAIGLDVGDRWSKLAVLDREGNRIEERAVASTEHALKKVFGAYPRARVALEVGTHSPWMSRVLELLGHEVIVANPRLVPVISTSQRKSDKVDARTLADLAFLKPELLHPIQHRGKEAQADLAILRARHELVKTRTTLVNHVRSSVKSFGRRVPSCSTEAFEDKVAEHIPKELRPALMPVLVSIRALTKEIRNQTRLIERLCRERYPDTGRVTQVPGVGPLTGFGYVLTLEHPKRFSKSRKVGAYLGLTPRQKDSGASRPQLGISKCGDAMLRSLLVQSAHYILGPFGQDSDLRRHGDAIARRGGTNAKKRAVIAVARKLAVLLHRLWSSGARYEPLRSSARKRATGKMVVSSARA